MNKLQQRLLSSLGHESSDLVWKWFEEGTSLHFETYQDLHEFACGNHRKDGTLLQNPPVEILKRVCNRQHTYISGLVRNGIQNIRMGTTYLNDLAPRSPLWNFVEARVTELIEARIKELKKPIDVYDFLDSLPSSYVDHYVCELASILLPMTIREQHFEKAHEMAQRFPALTCEIIRCMSGAD